MTRARPAAQVAQGGAGGERQRLYRALWLEADTLLRAADPCAFQGDRCAAGLTDGCCLCDEHRPGEPCGRTSLGCKLHLCALVTRRHPALARALDAIAARAEASGFTVEIFSTWAEQPSCVRPA